MLKVDVQVTQSTPATCPPGTTGPDSQGQCTSYSIHTSNMSYWLLSLSAGQCVAASICPPPPDFKYVLPNQQIVCAFAPTDDGNGHATCSSGGTFNPILGICNIGQPTCPSGTSLGDIVGGGPAHGATCISQPTCTTGTLQNDQCTNTTTTQATCPSDYQLQGAQCTNSQSTPPTCPDGYTGPDSQGQCTKTTTTQATCPDGYTGPDSQDQCTSYRYI